MTFSALQAVCGTCRSTLLPSSRATDGVATEYCGTCQIESVTTLRGHHAYDQRPRLEAQLAKDFQRDASPANPKFRHPRTMHRLEL